MWMDPEDWFQLPEGVEYLVQSFQPDEGWTESSSMLDLSSAKSVASQSAQAYGIVTRVARISRYSQTKNALIQSIVQVYYPHKGDKK